MKLVPERVPRMSKKKGLKASWNQIFGIVFDDFPKILSTLGTLHFEKSSHMPKKHCQKMKKSLSSKT